MKGCLSVLISIVFLVALSALLWFGWALGARLAGL